MPERSERIFISSSFEDRDFAQRLGSVLRNRGATVFQPSDMMMPGSDWAEVLRSELEQSSALILVIPSQSAANRNNVLFEAGAARALGKRIFAVLPPNHTSRIELPIDIADLLIMDADRRPLESIADTLLQAVPI